MIEIINKNGKTYARIADLRIAKTNVRQTDLIIGEEIECKDQDLADSLEAVGQKQPIVCDSNGNVFIGGRRLRAAKIAGKDLVEVKVEDIPEKDQLRASFEENWTQKSMSPFEVAKFFKVYMKEAGITSENEVAKLLKVSQQTVSQHLRVYETFQGYQPLVNIIYDEQAEEGDDQALTFSKAAELVPLEKKTREALTKEVMNEGISRNQLRRIIKSSQALEELVDNLDSEADTKAAKEVIKDKLYTKEMKPMDLFYEINEAIGNPNKLSMYPFQKIYTKVSDLPNQEAADAWFEERGGRCLGKEEVWYGELDRKQFEKKKPRGK